MSTKPELAEQDFLHRELATFRSPYNEEYEFYTSLSNGDIDKAKMLYKPIDLTYYGILSEDRIRNIKYYLMVRMALISRFCIESGLSVDSGKEINRIFSSRIDKCEDETELLRIDKEICLEYAHKMRSISMDGSYSKHILMCLDLIYENIYSGIRVQELADKLGLSAQYLSKLFRQEVGVTISEYIMSCRIMAAENMLKYSDYSSIEIGSFLNFSSHSHFISAFRKHTGLTPKQFREEYFRINWKSTHDV